MGGFAMGGFAMGGFFGRESNYRSLLQSQKSYLIRKIFGATMESHTPKIAA